MVDAHDSGKLGERSRLNPGAAPFTFVTWQSRRLPANQTGDQVSEVSWTSSVSARRAPMPFMSAAQRLRSCQGAGRVCKPPSRTKILPGCEVFCLCFRHDAGKLVLDP